MHGTGEPCISDLDSSSRASRSDCYGSQGDEMGGGICTRFVQMGKREAHRTSATQRCLYTPHALLARSARARQNATLRPRARRAEVSQTLREPPRPVTRGFARPQQLQRLRAAPHGLVEEAPACGVQSRARDRIASVVGRREVCGHGTERAGGVSSEMSAPLPPRCEQSRFVCCR